MKIVLNLTQINSLNVEKGMRIFMRKIGSFNVKFSMADGDRDSGKLGCYMV